MGMMSQYTSALAAWFRSPPEDHGYVTPSTCEFRRAACGGGSDESLPSAVLFEGAPTVRIEHPQTSWAYSTTDTSVTTTETTADSTTATVRMDSGFASTNTATGKYSK